jgi:hypothetical protein
MAMLVCAEQEKIDAGYEHVIMSSRELSHETGGYDMESHIPLQVTILLLMGGT